jgi:hypothetical protein
MHRRRPREKAVNCRVTGCCGGIGKRHSDQHGKEPAGRPCCTPHGVCAAFAWCQDSVCKNVEKLKRIKIVLFAVRTAMFICTRFSNLYTQTVVNCRSVVFQGSGKSVWREDAVRTANNTIHVRCSQLSKHCVSGLG